ncbi:HEPN domain-containing protein [Chloroflexota bacterium]
MRVKYISDKCKEINELVEEAKKWAERDEKLGAHLATYINVMMLGILEECIEHLVKERAKKPGDKEIENYISKNITQSFKNPSYGAICSVLSRFSDQYQSEFQKAFSPNSSEAAALESILRNKTDVAHYGLANLNLSINDVEKYILGVKNILEKLEDLLLAEPIGS